MRRFKLFIGISLVLHFLMMGLFFVSWKKKDGEWQGGVGDKGLVTVELSQFTPYDNRGKKFFMSTGKNFFAPTENRQKVVSRKSGGSQGEGNDMEGNTSPDTLAKIRQKILQAKQYPLVAKRQGLEGRVQIFFALNSSGGIQALSVVESSGFPLLDQEALATVKRASPYPYYSEDIVVSLKFELTE